MTAFPAELWKQLFGYRNFRRVAKRQFVPFWLSGHGGLRILREVSAAEFGQTKRAVSGDLHRDGSTARRETHAVGFRINRIQNCCI